MLRHNLRWPGKAQELRLLRLVRFPEPELLLVVLLHKSLIWLA